MGLINDQVFIRLDLIWFVHIELWCSWITQYSTEYILWYYIQMAYVTKNKMIYASNKNTQGVGYGYGGFRDSVDMGILWGVVRYWQNKPTYLSITHPITHPWRHLWRHRKSRLLSPTLTSSWTLGLGLELGLRLGLWARVTREGGYPRVTRELAQI